MVLSPLHAQAPVAIRCAYRSRQSAAPLSGSDFNFELQGRSGDLTRPPLPSSSTQHCSQVDRRSTLLLAVPLIAGVAATPQSPAHAKIVPPPPVSRRNLKKAQEEGERRREELEAAKGPIRETPSGIQYRELQVGTGKEARRGDVCDIAYEIFTAGGFYLDSVGFGMESKHDVGDTVRIQLETGKVPTAVLNAMRGMREGGRRRILVTPNFGWTNHDMQPSPSSAYAARRFWRYNNDNTPLLFEVELVTVLKGASSAA